MNKLLKAQPLHVVCISIKRALLNVIKVCEKLERALADEKSIKKIYNKNPFRNYSRLKGEREK
jgi:hypothetical protein